MTTPRTAKASRREALLAALRAQPAGLTIYGLARELGRPYRRVFESVRRLAAEGAVRVEPVLRKNRRATLVSAAPAESGRSVSAMPAQLSELERSALRDIAARLGLVGPRIASLHLFGSRARAESRWDSDLDIAVRVRGRRDPKLERRILAAIADVEWGVPLDGALRISPMVLFAKERRSAVDNAIDREGITIWKARFSSPPAGSSRRRRTN